MDLINEELKSEKVLEEIKRQRRVNEVVDVEEERVKIVVFSVAGRRYAFYGANIKEILPAGEISWVPSLPDYLPGLINVRGDIESVVDICYFLGERTAAPDGGFILLTVCGDFQSGVRVDTIEDVVDVPVSAVEPPLSTLGGMAGDLVAGEIRLGRETATLLDIEKLSAGIIL
jgi:purine-binding chemotaxis protein CheW